MEKNKFDIGGTVEQKPFEKYSFAKFFEDWCRKNGSVMPEVISREKWEKEIQNGLIQKREDGERRLLIPQDLQLWEISGITEAIQNETFPHDSEKQNRANEEIQKLGKTFRNAGIYIAQRSHSIEEGREIARALSEELYKYGETLLTGKKSAEANPWEKIVEEEMTEEDLAETDKFLAGDPLFASRIKQVEEGENEEIVRQQTLAQFFRTAKKAFLLEKKSKKEGLIHSEFLRKIEDSLKREIEKPKAELVGSVFQKGMELLRSGMPLPRSSSFKDIDRLISFWETSEASLGETLGVYRMKAELEKIRQTGDVLSISKKEREITDKIQRAVSSYAYEEKETAPSFSVETRKIDCVIGSMLGGSLLSQAGVLYLVGDIPEHSLLVASFTDGTVEWRDMIQPERNAKINDEMIEGNKRDGKAFIVSDFSKLAYNPPSEKVILDIKGDAYGEKFSWVKEEQRQLTVFSPSVGHRVQALNNMGIYLLEKGENEENTSEQSVLFRMAIEAFSQSILIDPKDTHTHQSLGNAFFHLGRYEEAKKEYRKVLSFSDPLRDREQIEKIEKLLRELEESNP